MSEIEEISGRYKDKHQQYNSSIRMWDDMQVALSHISTLEEKIKQLQEERDGYKNGQIQLQGMVDDLMDVNAKWAKRVEKLQEAIDRHEIFKRAHEKVLPLEDEELYQKRKEV